MTTLASSLVPIGAVAGVQPSTDRTPFSTDHYTFSKAIRFVNGIPEKIGGWRNFPFINNVTIDGVARSMTSASLDLLSPQSLIGTNTKLYSLIGQNLTNITPLETTTIAIANSLDTDYDTLANNPFTTVLDSMTVTVSDTNASLYQTGDIVTLSGTASVGGISNTALNGDHIIRTIGVNVYTINVGVAATSSTTGGGASVVRATGLINVNATAHGRLDGDRVKITGATNTGGILAAEINKEFVIRNVSTDDFMIYTAGTATSSVSAAGGAATEFQEEIPAGARDESIGQGYGMGRYGVGLYGVAKFSSNGRRYPRIWFFDRFGVNFIMTPGNQTGLYTWDGDTQEAPVLVANAPAAINYAFVSNGTVVTFGAGGVPNKIFASDQNDYTEWTSSSVNQVFEDNIEGAGRLTSHVSVNGVNLLFTEYQTYIFQYIGLPLVWSISLLEPGIGLIAPMARVVVKGVAYWMGQGNFYRWSGGNVEVVPANTQLQSTILNYVYQNYNFSQKSKIFCWYNGMFDEIWWHYPSLSENDPERIARLSLQDGSWCMDEIPRTGAEYPSNPYGNPRLLNAEGNTSFMYIHETGSNDDTESLPFTLSTNLLTIGKDTVNFDGIIPDSTQSGDLTFNASAFLYPQQGKSFDQDYTVSPTTGRLAAQGNGRFMQYTWDGDVLDQSWRLGKWQVYIQKGSPT